jgi:hypothetical protein
LPFSDLFLSLIYVKIPTMAGNSQLATSRPVRPFKNNPNHEDKMRATANVIKTGNGRFKAFVVGVFVSNI